MYYEKRKYTVILTFLLVCVSLLVMNPFKEDIWDSNFKLLKNEISSKSGAEGKVNLPHLPHLNGIKFIHSLHIFQKKQSMKQ